MNGALDLENLLSIPRLGDALVSPDGRRVAWTWTVNDDTPDVYATSATGDGDPVRLSTTEDRTVLRSWTPDSQSVIAAQDHDGDERVALFRINVAAPGVLEPLTEESPPYYLQGGEIHPGGEWLVYGMNFDVTVNREIEETWVYRHNLKTGERLPLARPRKATDLVPELNRAGTHILYTRQDRNPSGVQVWLVDINGTTDREILNAGDDVKVSAHWFPDSHRVLFVADAGEYRRLGVWDLTNDETVWLIDDPRRAIEWAVVAPGLQNQAVVVEVREARVHASIVDVDSGHEHALVPPQGSFVPLGMPATDTWIGRYSAAQHPADLVAYRNPVIAKGSTQSIIRNPADAHSMRDLLAPAESIHWEADDGLRIQGWLFRAKGRARGTIVHVHGGPTAHSEDDFDARLQFLVSSGYHVLLPNYRGSTGFGLQFEESIKIDGWGGREQEDIRSGIEALLERGIAEPGRVGITGTSYGGYSSWFAITHWPRRIVAASAPICGMTDLVVDYETTRPDLRPYSEEMMGGSPQQQPERYFERSPINFVRNIEGHLLIVQGARDPNVTIRNVEAVRAELDAARIRYDVLVFDDEGHGIKKASNVALLYRTLLAFFSSAFDEPTDPEA